MTWRWAEAVAGREEVVDLLLGGACPCYRTYQCGDGKTIAVSALEPKFWLGFVSMFGVEDLDSAGFAMGEEGAAVVGRVEELLSVNNRAHWLAEAEKRGLPISAVNTTAVATDDPLYADAGLLERLQIPGDADRVGVGPWLPDIGRTPARPAPGVGEHTDVVLEEVAREGSLE
jgi:crotonobetainyl-CoA:carnitine CoA-transferase CaiB-like acyl-CoA transferase